MSTSKRRSFIPVLVLTTILAACGGGRDDGTSGEPIDPKPTATASPIESTELTIAPPSGGEATPGGGSSDIVVAAPSGSSDVPLAPVNSVDLPIVVSITVGVDSAPERIESVPIGSTVSLSVLNPDVDDEYHLHGYEIGDGLKVAAGITQTFTFTADSAGDFEFESHDTDALLLTLRVG